MCGIVGQMTFVEGYESFLGLDGIYHRGPDGDGEWRNEQKDVYLGHTRLAILDLTNTGKQPMSDSSNRYRITFNGEIYNHLELRKLLPHVFWRGTSDTETLLEYFSQNGIPGLSALKGMFAFAVYDELEGTFTLIRDRLGIKPLWYRMDENSFRFASEARALTVKGEDVRLSVKALSEYIAYGRMPGNGEIFNGIQSVEPGGWIKISSNGKMDSGRWWPKTKFLSNLVKDQDTINRHVNKLITEAVEEHLLSDVGVGAFLSGGIDSSIITIAAGKKIGKALKTFTVGFPSFPQDERLLARTIAKQAGTDHYEIEITQDDSLKWVTEAVAKLDLPSVDAINTYIVSKAVHNAGIKVALSGLGGDELFGGYPSFQSVPLLKWFGSLPQRIRSSTIRILPDHIQEKLISLPSYSPIGLALARRRFVSVRDLNQMGLLDGTPDVEELGQNTDTMSSISWAEIQGYMIPMLLRDTDQMSMATGLEVRVPYLDHGLVEEVLSIPEKYKRGKGVKPLLVNAFKSELPADVYQRKKQGFELPMSNWIRKPLATFTEEGIQAAADYFQLKEPILKKKSFDEGKLHWSRVWSWCVLGHWIKANDSKTICVDAGSQVSLSAS